MPMNKQSSAKGNPLVKNKKDLLHLLEEVQTVAQTLCNEKASLGDQVKKIEPELSKLRAQETQLTQALQAKTELTQKVKTLQASHADLTKELKATKAQLAQALKAKTEFTQEIQTLQVSHADLTKELQATKAQLAQALQPPQSKAEPTKIEADLSKLRAEKTQEIWNLQDINAHLTEELQATKAQLTQAKQAPTTPTEPTQEMQTLQDSYAQLTKELQETKAQLTQAKQAPQSKAEPTQEAQTLQASHAQLTKELQETKAQLTGQLQETQHKLDAFHPEFQSLQDELQNVELQSQFLDMELLKKNEEIKDLESRLSAYTSLPSSSLPVDESIVSSSPTPLT
jgi:chromosome segregation protein